MGYCWTCGWHTDAMTAPAGLDPHTRMCRWCRDNWQPSGPVPADLGSRAQPQPLGVTARDGSRTRMPQGVHGDLVSGRDNRTSRQLPHRVTEGRVVPLAPHGPSLPR